MPNDNGDKGAGNGAGDGGAGGGDQGNGAGAGNGGAGDEKVTLTKVEHDKLQADLKKAGEDRDNYKTGILAKEKEITELKGGGKGADGGNGGGQGQGGGNAGVVDEAKAGEIATVSARKVQRETSERTAKQAFLKSHPEYSDDTEWQGLVSNLSFKGTELTESEVRDRMEAALLEHKRSTGKLDEHLNTIREEGRNAGRIEGTFDGARSAGGSGDRGGQGGGGNVAALTPKGQEMARAMHVDPEKAGKIDPSKDNVIDITK